MDCPPLLDIGFYVRSWAKIDKRDWLSGSNDERGDSTLLNCTDHPRRI